MKNTSVPKYFRACILEARVSRTGYSAAGWHLAIHLDEHVEVDQLDGLATALVADDAELETRTWFDSTLPGCSALVPKRRWTSFMKGVELAVEQGRLEL